MNQQHRHSLQSMALTCASVLLALVATSCQRETPATTEQTTSAETRARSVPPRDVRTEQVVSSRFRRSIEATGTVAFDQNRSTQVLSPISGPVVRILVEIGRHVGRDEALAIVSSPDFAAAMSALRKAEATARNARRVAELDRQLFKNDAIARRDMEQAETDAVGAEADRDSALQQLRSLGVNQQTLEDIQQNRPVANPGGIIRSPLAGTVVERLISPGQLLQAGTTPCFTVADLSSVWVIANVFEADLPFVKIGDSAEVLTGAGRGSLSRGKSATSRRSSIRTPAPSPCAWTFRIRERCSREICMCAWSSSRRLRARDCWFRFRPCCATSRAFPSSSSPKPDGTFARQSVQIGSRIGDHQEITSGLTAGQSIVVEGGLFLSAVEHS